MSNIVIVYFSMKSEGRMKTQILAVATMYLLKEARDEHKERFREKVYGK